MTESSDKKSGSTEDAPEMKTAKPKKRTRRVRPYPLCAYAEALDFAKSIQKNAGSQQIRRLTLFDAIQKAPESGPSRTLVSNTAKYGLIEGGPGTEYLQLTENGNSATSEDASERARVKARISTAILSVEPFNLLYEGFKGNKLPIHSVLADSLKDADYALDDIEVLVDNFIVNAEEVGLLKTLSGAQRIVEVDHALEGINSSQANPALPSASVTAAAHLDSHNQATSSVNFDNICFYVSPIGADDSEHRQHSDLFLGSIIEPAIESVGLKVVRADQIEHPGMITNQVIEYVMKSKLVVADLSFTNPNVFYELALRHMMNSPVVQIVRKGDPIPFDISQFRTVVVDCSSIYSLVPKLETYRAEIASQARMSLSGGSAHANPITSVYPNINVSI